MLLNNSTQSSATQLSIDDIDVSGTDISTYLRTIDDSTSTIKGHVKITNYYDANEFVMMTINSLTEHGTYFDVSVTVLGYSTSSPFTNDEEVLITFARSGDKGEQGTQGYQGSTGSIGVQGATGFQGAQGVTGMQGEIGNQGATGAKGEQGIEGATGFQGMTGSAGAVNVWYQNFPLSSTQEVSNYTGQKCLFLSSARLFILRWFYC